MRQSIIGRSKYLNMPRKDEDNIILKMSFDFAIEIMSYCELLDEIKKWALSNQLFKSGTSIGANIREAQNAESKADFIHKFKIAAKECEETKYWLDLINHSKKLPAVVHLIDKIIHIDNIISKIIITSKTK
jgi:four helix bundle protein